MVTDQGRHMTKQGKLLTLLLYTVYDRSLWKGSNAPNTLMSAIEP